MWKRLDPDKDGVFILDDEHYEIYLKEIANQADKQEDSQTITEAFIETLNEVFKTDPSAIRTLINSNTQCNRQLAESPHIPVDRDVNLQGEHYRLSTLDLINGLLRSIGQEEILIDWKDDKEGPNIFLGFKTNAQSNQTN